MTDTLVASADGPDDGRSFWSRKLGGRRGLAPARPADDLQDISDLDLAEYGEVRAELIPESSDFLGIEPWKRPNRNETS